MLIGLSSLSRWEDEVLLKRKYLLKLFPWNRDLKIRIECCAVPSGLVHGSGHVPLNLSFLVCGIVMQWYQE